LHHVTIKVTGHCCIIIITLEEERNNDVGEEERECAANKTLNLLYIKYCSLF